MSRGMIGTSNVLCGWHRVRFVEHFGELGDLAYDDLEYQKACGWLVETLRTCTACGRRAKAYRAQKAKVRRARAGLSPTDPRHGSVEGFHAGCRAPCCREVHNAYERRRRKRIALYGSSGLRINPVGTRRRIEALMWLGWTSQEIADACGWTGRNDVLRLCHDVSWIKPRTAQKIDEVFERLCLVEPPEGPLRERSKREARAKGYVSALAWEDIDDENAEPVGLKRKRT